MRIHSEDEVEEKIQDCIQNEKMYVEWLCQNQTEKQLERKLKSIEKLNDFALHNNIARHVPSLTDNSVRPSETPVNTDVIFTISKSVVNNFSGVH